MPEDIEKLVIDIEVIKEEASKKLKEFQKEIDKLSTSEEKLNKIRSLRAKYSGKDKNASQQQKIFNKEIRDGLKLQSNFIKNQSDFVPKSKVTQQKKSIKEVAVEQNKTAKKINDAYKKIDFNPSESLKEKTVALKKEQKKSQKIPSQVQENKQEKLQESVEIEGFLTKKITNEQTGLVKEISKEYDKAGNIITNTYKTAEDGQRKLISKTENFKKKKYKTPDLQVDQLVEVQGEEVKRDTVNQKLQTKQILEDNKERVNSYEKVIEVNGKLQGVLKSSVQQKTKQKVPDVKILEDVEGEVLKYDSVKHTLQTEQIIDNNKKIIRSYKNVQETVNGYKGSLESSSVVKNTNTSLSRIKRIFQSIIAFRLASSFINLFIGSFKQGIQTLKSAGGELSKPFVEFQQATMAIKVSLGTIVIPLIQTLTSILDPLSEKFVNLANVISYTNAVIKGQSEYYKLSTEKIDEYTKSLNQANKALTQLDKFATLNKQNSVVLGEMVSIDANTEEGLQNIINIEKIKEEIKPVLEFIEKLKVGFNKVIETIQYLGSEEGKVFREIGLSLLALISPFGRIIAIFLSFKTLMSQSSPIAKTLANSVIALAAAYSALAIAKAFARSKAEGIATLALIGMSVATGFVSVKALSSSIGGTSGGTGSNPPQTESFTQQQQNYNGLQTTQQQPTIINTTIEVDGRKLAQVTAPHFKEAMKKQNLI